ncbi:MAG: two-component system response regulator [Acidimicrobiia bacterium]
MRARSILPHRPCPGYRQREESLEETSPHADRTDVASRVLVIEDSASVRRLIEVCLRVLDVELAAAEDGLRGLEVARELVPDVIVLDVGLPGMDGWEVLRHLRAGNDTRDVRVLVLTAHAQPEIAEQAAQGGADDFMTKPFRPMELRERIEKLLAG